MEVKRVGVTWGLFSRCGFSLQLCLCRCELCACVCVYGGGGRSNFKRFTLDGLGWKLGPGLRLGFEFGGLILMFPRSRHSNVPGQFPAPPPHQLHQLHQRSSCVCDVCACECACVCVCVCVHARTCARARVCMCVCECARACLGACTCVRVYVCLPGRG